VSTRLNQGFGLALAIVVSIGGAHAACGCSSRSEVHVEAIDEDAVSFHYRRRIAWGPPPSARIFVTCHVAGRDRDIWYSIDPVVHTREHIEFGPRPDGWAERAPDDRWTRFPSGSVCTARVKVTGSSTAAVHFKLDARGGIAWQRSSP